MKEKEITKPIWSALSRRIESLIHIPRRITGLADHFDLVGGKNERKSLTTLDAPHTENCCKIP